MNFKPIAAFLGAVAIALAAWLFIENRIHEIADDTIRKHVDVHTANHGQLPSGVAVPYVKTGQTVFPEGWGLCNPSMDGLFLVGTARLDKVGDPVGTPNHQHEFELRTDISGGWHQNDPETADQHVTEGRNWVHRHNVEGRIDEKEHLPPATKVLFLCRKDSNSDS